MSGTFKIEDLGGGRKRLVCFTRPGAWMSQSIQQKGTALVSHESVRATPFLVWGSCRGNKVWVHLKDSGWVIYRSEIYVNGHRLAEVSRTSSGSHIEIQLESGWKRIIRFGRASFSDYFRLDERPKRPIRVVVKTKFIRKDFELNEPWLFNGRRLRVKSDGPIQMEILPTTSPPYIIDPSGSFKGLTSDGYIWCHNTDPEDLVEQYEGIDLDDVDEWLDIYWSNPADSSGDTYKCARAWLIFDTSAVPSDVTITSVRLSFYVFWVNPAGVPVKFYKGATAPHIPLVLSDYNLNYWGSEVGSTQVNDVDIVQSVDLSTDVVNPGGITSIGIRVQGDFDSSHPDSLLQIASGEAEDPPYLIVEWTGNQPPSPPTSLRCNSQSNPTLLDQQPTGFDAIYNDPDTGDTALYARVQVATDSGFTDIVWDSQKTSIDPTTEGSRCSQIPYGGPSLAPGTYYWRIKFWDDDDAEGDWSTETAYFIIAQTISTQVESSSRVRGQGQLGVAAAAHIYSIGTLTSPSAARLRGTRTTLTTSSSRVRGTGALGTQAGAVLYKVVKALSQSATRLRGQVSSSTQARASIKRSWTGLGGVPLGLWKLGSPRQESRRAAVTVSGARVYGLLAATAQAASRVRGVVLQGLGSNSRIRASVRSMATSQSRVRAELSSSVEAGARLRGTAESTAVADVRLRGRQDLASQSGARIRGRGQLGTQSDARLRGPVSTQIPATGRLRGTGEQTVSAAAKLFRVSEGDIGAEARIRGTVHEGIAAAAHLYTYVTTHTTAQTRISGVTRVHVAGASRSRGRESTSTYSAARLRGDRTQVVPASARVRGVKRASTPADCRLQGKFSMGVPASARIRGAGVFCTEADARLRGQTSLESVSTSRVKGHFGVGFESAARLRGQSVLSSQATARFRGRREAAVTSSARLRAKLTSHIWARAQVLRSWTGLGGIKLGRLYLGGRWGSSRRVVLWSTATVRGTRMANPAALTRLSGQEQLHLASSGKLVQIFSLHAQSAARIKQPGTLDVPAAARVVGDTYLETASSARIVSRKRVRAEAAIRGVRVISIQSDALVLDAGGQTISSARIRGRIRTTASSEPRLRGSASLTVASETRLQGDLLLVAQSETRLAARLTVASQAVLGASRLSIPAVAVILPRARFGTLGRLRLGLWRLGGWPFGAKLTGTAAAARLRGERRLTTPSDVRVGVSRGFITSSCARLSSNRRTHHPADARLSGLRQVLVGASSRVVTNIRAVVPAGCYIWSWPVSFEFQPGISFDFDYSVEDEGS